MWTLITLALIAVYFFGAGVAIEFTDTKPGWSWDDEASSFFFVVFWPLALWARLGRRSVSYFSKEERHQRELEDIKRKAERAKAINEANKILTEYIDGGADDVVLEEIEELEEKYEKLPLGPPGITY